jgi:hypothetical protein
LISERDTLQSKVELLNKLKARSDLSLTKLARELQSVQAEKETLKEHNEELED